MSKTTKTFRERLHVGTVLRCVENTYSMQTHGVDRSGKLATITKVGVNVFSAEMDGKPYRMTFPARKSDVVSVSDDRITHKIGRGDHTVTWEIVPVPSGDAVLMDCAECGQSRLCDPYDDRCGPCVEQDREPQGEPVRLFAPAPAQLDGQLSF